MEISYTIRTATARDIPAIAWIERIGSETPRHKEELQQMFRSRELRKWVAETSGRWPSVIGVLIVNDRGDNTAFIDTLTVVPGWRRCGVGSDLLQELDGYDCVGAQTPERNVPGQLFLRANGFTYYTTSRNQQLENADDTYLFSRGERRGMGVRIAE